MARYESRSFRNPVTDELEKRVVDTLSPNSLIPAGTKITCEGGHVICEMAESLFIRQRVEASAFGPVAAFQKPIIHHQRLGPCFCGREYALKGSIHTEHGWSPRSPHSEA